MNKKNIIILIIATIFFLIALAIFIYANYKKPSQNDTSKTTITKTVEDSNIAKQPYIYNISGEKLNLSDFKNKPQVILLWKSDNSKSYDILNLFQTYYDDYKDKINFLAINVNEANIDINLIDNIKAANFNIPIYFDTDFTLTSEFNYEKLPYIAFIDIDGTIGKEAIETINEDTFQANIELMSNEQ